MSVNLEIICQPVIEKMRHYFYNYHVENEHFNITIIINKYYIK